MPNGQIFAVSSEQAGGIELRPGEARRVVFNVQNISGRSLRGRAAVRPEAPAQQGWFTIEGNAERPFGEGEVHHFAVEIALPDDAPEGRYPFEVECVWVDRPDEGFGRSEKVALAVRPKPEKNGGTPPWVWLVAASVVLVVAGAIAWLWPDGEVEAVPALEGEPVDEAIATLEELELELGETVPVHDGEAEADRVLASRPAAGEPAEPGDVIDLVVSAGPLVTEAEHGLELVLEADRERYAPGDPVELTLILRNPGADPISLTFGSTQRSDFLIRDLDGETHWRWSEGFMFPQVVQVEQLAAGQSRDWQGRHEEELPLGWYVAEGVVTATEALRAETYFFVASP